jgi:hypothetical protein
VRAEADEDNRAMPTATLSGTPPLPPPLHQHHPSRSLLPRASSMPLNAGVEWAERAAREGVMDMMMRGVCDVDMDGGEQMGVGHCSASVHTPPHTSDDDGAAARATEAVRALQLELSPFNSMEKRAEGLAPQGGVVTTTTLPPADTIAAKAKGKLPPPLLDVGTLDSPQPNHPNHTAASSSSGVRARPVQYLT